MPVPGDGFLLSERQAEYGTIQRIACETPPAGAVPAEPGLEDAFLCIYREGRSHAAAARWEMGRLFRLPALGVSGAVHGPNGFP